VFWNDSSLLEPRRIDVIFVFDEKMTKCKLFEMFPCIYVWCVLWVLLKHAWTNLILKFVLNCDCWWFDELSFRLIICHWLSWVVTIIGLLYLIGFLTRVWIVLGVGVRFICPQYLKDYACWEVVVVVRRESELVQFMQFRSDHVRSGNLISTMNSALLLVRFHCAYYLVELIVMFEIIIDGLFYFVLLVVTCLWNVSW
jgi:hypothetical protein